MLKYRIFYRSIFETIVQRSEINVETGLTSFVIRENCSGSTTRTKQSEKR